MILWNNVSLDSKGIIVEHKPTIAKGKKRISTYEVEGRNGLLVVDKGTYDPFVVSVECHINTNVTTLEKVKEFLDGYGTLSFDGVKEYTAIVNNQIDFEQIKMFRKFVIQFLVNPLAKDIQESTINAIDNNITQTITDATCNMNPIITIKGSGNVQITINNKTFYLYSLVSGLTYTLDCENKVIKNNNGINCSNLMAGDFPYLVKGENTISYIGTLNTFSLAYHKTYI